MTARRRPPDYGRLQRVAGHSRKDFVLARVEPPVVFEGGLVVVNGIGEHIDPTLTVTSDCPTSAEIRALLREIRALVSALTPRGET